MLKKFVGGLVALLVCVGFIIADEAKGKLKSYEKGSITLTVDGKDKTFKLGKETKVTKGGTEVTGKDKGKLLKELKAGDEVTVVYEGKDVKEVKVK